MERSALPRDHGKITTRGESRQALPDDRRSLLTRIARAAEEVIGASLPAMRLEITPPRVAAWNIAAAHAALTGHRSASRLIRSRASTWWTLRHRTTATTLVHPSSVQIWVNGSWLAHATEFEFIEYLSPAVIEAILLTRGSAPALHILALGARYGARAADDHIIAAALSAEKERRAEVEDAAPAVWAALNAPTRTTTVARGSGATHT
jgi:hypothetical protein